MKPIRWKKEAFTLVELLTVLAIIVILAAILFPVFDRAYDSSRRANCMSNLKQIGMAVVMYTQDNDERFLYSRMYAKNNSVNGTDYLSWPEILQPYTKSIEVFKCPISPINKKKLDGGYTMADYGGTGYGANNLLLRDFAYYPAGIALSSLTSPANTYMIEDSGNTTFSPGDLAVSSNSNYIPGMGSLGLGVCNQQTNKFYVVYKDDCETGRHFDGINMAFADGHVKWLKTVTVFAELGKPNYGKYSISQ